jgi:hypothetical protein
MPYIFIGLLMGVIWDVFDDAVDTDTGRYRSSTANFETDYFHEVSVFWLIL